MLTATPAELRLLLFDGALRFANRAREGLATDDSERAYDGVTRCQAILLELINSLRPDHDEELCRNLSSLYTYLYTRLIDASTQRSVEAADEVITLLEYERETWSLLMDQLAQSNRDAMKIAALPDQRPHTDGGSTRSTSTDDLVGGNLSVEG